MSTVLRSSSAAGDASVASPRSAAREWLREPLLHFVVLGAVLFGIDHALSARRSDPHVIVLGEAVDKEASQLFAAARGREPSKAELEALRKVWLDNEVLYREGLAMRLDQGDPMIRDRIVFKALSTIDAGVRVPPADDVTLRAYFEKNRARYDEPARYDFEEAVPTAGQDEPSVRALVDRLNSSPPTDVAASLRVFRGRPLANLVQSYGDRFPAELEVGPRGSWRAIRTRDAWRAMRLVSIAPARPAEYDSLRGVVMQDWKDAVATEQRTAAVRSLQQKYRIVDEAKR